MMGSTVRLRAFTLGGAALLLAACTIGPRTPIEVPSDARAQDEKNAEPTKDKDDDFKLPEAEWVTDGQSQGQTKQKADSKSASTSFELGRAKFELGSTPPWAKLDQVERAAATTDKLSTRWRLKRTINVGEGYLHKAAFEPDGQTVVTLSNQTGHLYHYDLNGKLLKKIDLPDFEEFDDASFTPMAELPSRPQLFLTRPSGTSLVDLESGKIDHLEQAPAGTEVHHSPRVGLYGVTYRKTAPQSGHLTLIWVNGSVALDVDCHERPDDWALSPDGKFLAISYYPSDIVEIVDLENKKLVSKIKLPKYGGALDISPDGKLIALGGAKLVVASFPHGDVLAEDTKYDNNIDNVHFTPQGDLLLASAYDGKARSYVLPKDMESAKKLPTPQALAHSYGANVYALGMTPDGRSLVTSSGDKTLKIWTR